MADALCRNDDGGGYESVHPPNIVLVSSSTQTSPGQEQDLPICSPLSTAPNSPFRGVSYDDEDDDDEEEEVTPQEIQELLDTPASGKHGRSIRMVTAMAAAADAPFDESNHNPTSPSSRSNKKDSNKVRKESLLGKNPRPPYSAIKTTISSSPSRTNPAVVSPAAATMSGRSHVVERVDDIDAYKDDEEDLDEDDRAGKEEKKVDSGTPPRMPIYTASSSKSPRQFPSSYPRVVPSAVSEDESVPMDERPTPDWHPSPRRQKQQQSSTAALAGHPEEGQGMNGDFIERTRSDDEEVEDPENTTTPMKKALQSAEREVQEMERRVQLMLEQRRQTSQRSQQRFAQSPSFDDVQDPMIDIDGEPPSLSPTARRDVHSSIDSGTSSYYYDGSAVASTVSGHDSSINNTTIDTTFSTNLPPAGGRRPKENTDYYLAGVASPSHAFVDAFTSSFDQEQNNSSFAQVMSGTSKAFTQVTDDLTNFLVGPPSPKEPQQQQQEQSPASPPRPKYQPRENQRYSPSHDSDCTPHAGNLSPRASSSAKKSNKSFSIDEDDDDENIDVYYSRQRASAKLARARSLVSERKSKSPTSVPYHHHRGSSDDPKQRARQVMNKREREHQQQQQQQQQQSLSRPSSTSKRSISTAGRMESAVDRPTTSSRVSSASKQQQQQHQRSTREAEGSPPNIPFPPTLHRIAAMMEGSLGGGQSSAEVAQEAARDIAAAANASPTSGGDDWPSSVSQLVEEYQTAITASLRNLSIEEVSGLAAAAEAKKHVSPEFGRGTMVSPGVSFSPTTSSSSHVPPPPPDEDDQSTPSRSPNRERSSAAKPVMKEDPDTYDDFMEGISLGACLQMPQLNHPPLENSHSLSTANKVAGLLTCERNVQYEQPDEEDHQGRRERALFAKQLSERLLNLSPNASTDKSGSVDDPSPSKLQQVRKDLGISFIAKESSPTISMPMKTNPANFNDAMMSLNMSLSDARDTLRGGLYASNIPRDLPSDDQPSMISDSFSWEHPSRGATPDRSGHQSKPSSASKLHFSDSDGMANVKPTMVESIDNETGITKGDVMLSLLCDNSFYASKEKPDSWAWRVREAIWRGREMRRTVFKDAGRGGANEDGEARDTNRRSLPVDVDDVRVVGGIHNVASIQEKALAHMERDEFEQALELYEDIIFNYYSFFEQVLAKRDEFSSEDVTMELSNFKPYIGASLHNLGVIHLLKGDYEDAFSFFKRAVDNRRACLGEAHPDTVTSLVRLATCRFAMDNFADAHTNLELALALAGSKAKTTNDYAQLGEILNNLGCLSYMCGQPTKAMKLFREALDVQIAVVNSTLYGGSKFAAHSATLNISITRGNIGFLALVLKDVSSGIVALESALREQRLLLTGAHVTLVSTMDHLAVANLLENRTLKATKMLRRIYDMQRTAHGPGDPRTMATRQKIMTIRGQQQQAPPTASKGEGKSTPAQMTSPRPLSSLESAAGTAEKVSSSRSMPIEMAGEGFRHSPSIQRPLSQQPIRQASEGSNHPRSSANSVSTNGMNGGGGSGKVTSVFKAIRSLGRKKS